MSSMDPLRIGLLGAARIADEGIIEPARRLGHQLVSVAARDRARAEAFAKARRIPTIHDSYADVIADPQVDVIYNALVNSLHAEWNIAALRAGKHVLSEKPLTSNAAEAESVRHAAAASQTTIVEGFHYLHHPAVTRMGDLVTSGDLGEIRSVEITLAIPSPPDSDPRWSRQLAGGASMDLGCYVLSAARQLGRWTSGEPELGVVRATERAGRAGVDEQMTAELTYPDGTPARAHWDMNAPARSMVWTVTGSDATVVLPAFAVPHTDNRILITRGARTLEEVHGDRSSYTYQLAALAATLREGREFAWDVDQSVATMRLVDACYRAAGLPLRG